MSNTTATATATAGRSYTTGMVHDARPTGPEGQLTQRCGMGRRQLAYLAPTDAPVTCKRCLGLGA
jgi:hypothetical protein